MNSVGATCAETDKQGSNEGAPNDQNSGVPRGLNTSHVLHAVNSLIPHVRPATVIVVKSTVPVGTTDRLAAMPPLLEARIEVVSNPEFLRQGTAVHDFLQPDRVVIGASSPDAAARV